MELQDIKTSMSDASACLQAADRVDGMATRTGASEREALLSEQGNGSNGEMLSTDAAAVQTLEKANSIETSFSGRVKREMNEVVCSRVRLWLVILGIILFIIAVISISVIVVCSVVHEDEDENFDSSLFTVPRDFRGSFKLPNLDFSDQTLSGSKRLVEDLEGMMKSLFGASPALGRYFSEGRINSLGNGSVVANYQLRFLMPEDDQDQLTEFTLSRDTVYSVFRQFLYEQEPRESAPLYIDPASLSMSSAGKQ